MTKEIKAKHKALASHVARAFDTHKPPISRFADATGHSEIFVLEARDSPQLGVKSYATIGLSDSPMYLNGSAFPARVELVAACGSSFNGLAEALSTAAFCIINSHWFCAPGTVFPDIIGTQGISTTMSDLYFTHPFLWPQLKGLHIEEYQVAWLLAMPISRTETDFAQEHGPEKLEALFSEKDIDIFNLNRQPVV